jgi:hypothetical protein
MGFESRLRGMSSAGPSALRAGALALALVLSGCGSGDVELNGKIFDAMGVSPSTQKKSGDPKVAARNGLVMPPSTGSLPEPGSGVAPQAEADIAFINDPDRKRSIDQSELMRRQAEYCKVHYEQAKLRGDQAADAAVGPAGPCRSSILTSMKQWNASQDAEEAAEDEK